MRVSVSVLLLIGGLAALLFGLPPYFVWQQKLSGEAELRKAEYSRQVVAVEATAKRDAAKMLAEAEIERSKGVAQANRIIGDSLTNNEAYLRYLWVQSLAEGKSEVIYVPTEANLPVLEAGRLGTRSGRTEGGQPAPRRQAQPPLPIPIPGLEVLQ